MILKKVIRGIVVARGPTRGSTIKKLFGENKQAGGLMPFAGGLCRLEGLRRRPKFVAGDATVRCVARNAWEAGELRGAQEAHLWGLEFRQHETSYAGFTCMKEFRGKAAKRLEAAEGS